MLLRSKGVHVETRIILFVIYVLLIQFLRISSNRKCSSNRLNLADKKSIVATVLNWLFRISMLISMKFQNYKFIVEMFRGEIHILHSYLVTNINYNSDKFTTSRQ